MISTQDLIERGYQVRPSESFEGHGVTHVCWKRLPENRDVIIKFLFYDFPEVKFPFDISKRPEAKAQIETRFDTVNLTILHPKTIDVAEQFFSDFYNRYCEGAKE